MGIQVMFFQIFSGFDLQKANFATSIKCSMISAKITGYRVNSSGIVSEAEVWLALTGVND
jgi:hypothetical protein